MNEKYIYILTQDNCKGCDVLHNFITANEDINTKSIFVDKEKDNELFFKLVDKFKIMGTPSAIFGEKVLPSANPSSFKVFMRMNKI